MFFALLDAIDALWLFLEWLQFVIGMVLVMFLFLILMGLVVGFLDLILDPMSVFLGVIGKVKKGRRKRRRPGKNARPRARKKPSSRPRPRPKAQPRPDPQGLSSVPVGASVEEGGSFVLPHEMKVYFDEYMRQRGV